MSADVALKAVCVFAIVRLQSLKGHATSNYPQNSPSSPNNLLPKWDILVPKTNNNLQQKFWYSSRYLQLNGLQISTEVLCFRSPIWRCDNRTHLVSPREPPKHQKRDQIAHWILMAPAAAVANFKTDHGNLNCT